MRRVLGSRFHAANRDAPDRGPRGERLDGASRALDACWSSATALANWAVMELAKADIVRVPEMGERMPPMPRVYLYPEARRRFPTLDSKSLAAILNDAESRYRKSRLASIWLNRDRLPRYQYPVPYPVKSEAWTVEQRPGGESLLRVRLAGESWTLKLRGGHQFRRQLAMLAQLSSGAACPCEAALYRARAGGSHHATSSDRKAGGGGRTLLNVMAKLVLWLPRPLPKAAKSGALFVRTEPHALLSAFDADGKRIASFFADHVPRHVAEHRRALQRLKADMAVARSSSPARVVQLQERRERLCERQRHRVQSACHQAAAFVAGVAKRQGVAEVRYDDHDRSYVEVFPWFELRPPGGAKTGRLTSRFRPCGSERKRRRAKAVRRRAVRRRWPALPTRLWRPTEETPAD